MAEYRELVETAGDGSTVRGFLHSPEAAAKDGLVLTHGAGANCRAPLLIALAEEFARRGWTVLRYDLPFRQRKPFGPPVRGSAALDQAGVRAAIAVVRKLVQGRLFAGGHSYGGRQTTMLVATERQPIVDGMLLLSYPLHPPDKPTQMRTEHFPSLQTPAFFVQGIKDGFATADEISMALKLIPARTELLSIEGAGHELLNKKNQGELPGRIVNDFEKFFS